MEHKSMTALTSAFSRAYHSLHNEVPIFNDTVARQLITDEEYQQISRSMAQGIGFFNPSFVGTPEHALRWIVDNQLSPSPVARAAFAERALENAVRIGAKQYLIFGAGYDTFAYRRPLWAESLKVFEIDHPATAADKQERLKAANLAIPDNVYFVEADFTEESWQDALLNHVAFERSKISFCTLLGVTYYLSRRTFESLISIISDIVAKGSTIVFDYPDENSYNEKAGERAKKQRMLANAANEEMLESYSYREMESLLSDRGFLIYEHLTPQEMTEQYFKAYNDSTPAHQMTAFDNVNYCLAVKK